MTTEDKNFDRKLKEELKEVAANPKHQSDKKQVHAISGLGITSMVGSAGAEAVELVGQQFVEVVGGSFGVGLILYFVFKFFAVEMEEIAATL